MTSNKKISIKRYSITITAIRKIVTSTKRVKTTIKEVTIQRRRVIDREV